MTLLQMAGMGIKLLNRFGNAIAKAAMEPELPNTKPLIPLI
ncbi:hypothetical protein SDC9_151311 [bioreactor metagenome]|uniref:Uncharacterized protein n=1 Tax=bioreactor metagenome TaxID=1076179 RepID=A0A645EPX8_9ZZZZ